MAEKVVLLPLVLSKKSNPYDFSECTLIYPFLCLAVSPRQVSEKGTGTLAARPREGRHSGQRVHEKGRVFC